MTANFGAILQLLLLIRNGPLDFLYFSKDFSFRHGLLAGGYPAWILDRCAFSYGGRLRAHFEVQGRRLGYKDHWRTILAVDGFLDLQRTLHCSILDEMGRLEGLLCDIGGKSVRFYCIRQMKNDIQREAKFVRTMSRYNATKSCANFTVAADAQTIRE